MTDQEWFVMLVITIVAWFVIGFLAGMAVA